MKNAIPNARLVTEVLSTHLRMCNSLPKGELQQVKLIEAKRAIEIWNNIKKTLDVTD